jgi:hypothetical protein
MSVQVWKSNVENPTTLFVGGLTLDMFSQGPMYDAINIKLHCYAQSMLQDKLFAPKAMPIYAAGAMNALSAFPASPSCAFSRSVALIFDNSSSST